MRFLVFLTLDMFVLSEKDSFDSVFCQIEGETKLCFLFFVQEMIKVGLFTKNAPEAESNRYALRRPGL